MFLDNQFEKNNREENDEYIFLLNEIDKTFNFYSSML